MSRKDNQWVHKYSPKTIDELVLDPILRYNIDTFIYNCSNTHLIMTGPPGCGKTTTTLAIATALLPPEAIKTNFLKLNASNERGSKNIESLVVPFCKRVTPFQLKIVSLDEADGTVEKCQYEIIDIIKKYGKNIKFILTSNDSSKIVEGLQSICKILEYKPIANEQVVSHLIAICTNENIQYTTQGISRLAYLSNGDMRQAINKLQLISFNLRSTNTTPTNTTNTITEELVLDICKIPNPKTIKTLFESCYVNTTASLKSINQSLDSIFYDGYSCIDVLNILYDVVKAYDDSKCTYDQKINIISIIESSKIIVQTTKNSKLQAINVFSRIMSLVM
ncbi:Replication factor C small subunit [uncultured virus]|nr:Replication factor C small subunit [uncultured virus]